MSHCLLYYCHDWRHIRSIYFSICAAQVFWFAYAKVRLLTTTCPADSHTVPRSAGQLHRPDEQE